LNRVYFTDRDLGKRFPEILAAAGLTVERHHDVFPPDGPDEQWLEYCGTGDRIAITHNERIRYTPNELAAVERFDVALLVVVGKAPFPALARNFVRTLPGIEAFLDDHKPPFIAKIYRPEPRELEHNPEKAGSIALWYPR
jgi:hypothetical protein